jgi:glutamate synthase domain-containing protein 2/glutamate synthase domain-containing protein 1/glutamate synthase domain-containing protein 3
LAESPRPEHLLIMHRLKRPGAAGLYDPSFEHDACGIGAVADLTGRQTHETVGKALWVLDHLEHRGASGAEVDTGDGAGILLQTPHEFLAATAGFELPERGRYGVGVIFLPQDDKPAKEIQGIVEQAIEEGGQKLLGWRDVPVDHSVPGASAAAVEPIIRQVFVESTLGDAHSELAFERKLYVIRRVIEARAGEDIAIPSFSSRTLVYKGMLTSPQLPQYFADLSDERMSTALALVHSRFSTNTFPSWELAHPYRMICHNGEINTLRGNVNWMRARESQLLSEHFGDDLAKLLPVVDEAGSDSAIFDNVLEILVLGGRSLAHSLMMMVPEAWENHDSMPQDIRDFYAYHSCLMEPWDGPAGIASTDGHVIGATLDRNGLRPGRWQITSDDFVVLASETGVLEAEPEKILRKGRLQPGRLFFVDVEQGRVIEDAELKHQIAARRPYGQWYRDCTIRLDDLPDVAPRELPVDPVRTRQLMFGYSQEDLRITLARMGGASAEEPIGSMGNDFALAVLSDKSPSLYGYFKQLFAQVTNPPIDPIRERVVMSLGTAVGPQSNLFTETPEHAHQLEIKQPILSNGELEKLRQVDHDVFAASTLDATWPVDEGQDGLARRMEQLCAEASERIDAGGNILILSDRAAGADRVPIPALLAVSGVHHHLVRQGNRLQTGLVVESGEPREVHHICCLLGYGAAAVNPYLAFETLHEMLDNGFLPGVETAAEADAHFVKAMGKAILKTMSKMGISTVASYSGAQIFEAVGLERDLIERYFTGTTSRIGGIGLDVLAREAIERHQRAYPLSGERLPVGGVHMWRRDGEFHQWNPDTIAKVQHAVRHGGQEGYEDFTRTINEANRRRATLRGLLELNPPERGIDIEEVEPAKEIVKRFATGAMSLGSLSREAHETLAIAMNRIGGKSNTGEGGEDPSRYELDPNGDSRRSAIKQVASGRFGVTAHYLVNADELQIKIAQGAKPGEGGQLPGHKVDEYIAHIRHSMPGVGLISPPPHHDIYSIEDLKQLIFDLRCANPKARISVKLVSEVGVGTVAAGVAKANSDHVVIAGHDGGTGASPVSSIHSAGVPWEIGLAETQQTLVMNKLRDRIVVQADGQMKTGRDVMIGALLGAEEFGFSTAPLISLGCIYMRACHLNTCPVGIATQDPELRKRFEGSPEHVVNFFFFVAEEVRGLMAQLGVSKFEDLIGRTDLLRTDTAIDHWKASGVDLSSLLAPPDAPPEVPRRRVRPQDPVLDDHLDHEIMRLAEPALERGERVSIALRAENRDRCVGGLISGAIARRYGQEGLPEGTIDVQLEGAGGQSFGGWLAPGVTLTLTGDANDYTGKGLSGGVLTVRPPEGVPFVAEKNVVIGNTVLYGATGGRAFFRGLAGERFCVRNSGAEAVVEGVGDHGCEYMTGGRAVILGPTGRNFAAGMSGGVAYVLDRGGGFSARCNTEMVDLECPGEADLVELRALVEEHRDRTGSPVAERVLSDWDSLRRTWVKVMPLDYKRVLRERAEEAERASIEAGEPAIVAEHGDGDGAGHPHSGQGDAYPPGDGREETRVPGEAGQTEDAAVAAERAQKASAARGNGEAEQAQKAAEAEEEVLPFNG